MCALNESFGENLRKKVPNFHLTLYQSVRDCPIFLKFWLITNFDMDFQTQETTNDTRSRSEKVDFFERSVLGDATLNFYLFFQPKKYRKILD